MQNTIADGLAGAATHPITVQVINQGPGIWGNVATGFITAVAAILAVILTHRYTHWRDKQAAVQKLKRERLFIAAELIILLDQYAEGCAHVADDKGEVVHVSGKQPERAPVAGYPAPPDFDKVAGDWSSLLARHMFRIRELPLRQAGAMRAIDDAREHDSPGDYPAYFRERQYEFARLGLRAIIETRYLRELCDLPPAGRNISVWSANVIKGVLDEQRSQRVDDHIANKENKL